MGVKFNTSFLMKQRGFVWGAMGHTADLPRERCGVGIQRLCFCGYFFLIVPEEVIVDFAVIGRDQALLQTWGVCSLALLKKPPSWVELKVQWPLFFVSGILLCVP